MAQVAELVDAQVSGTCAERCGGSSPLLGTIPNDPIEESYAAFRGLEAASHPESKFGSLFSGKIV